MFLAHGVYLSTGLLLAGTCALLRPSHCTWRIATVYRLGEASEGAPRTQHVTCIGPPLLCLVWATDP